MSERRIESRFDARPSKHTGESKKPVCGDSRHDLNYPEIPDSWGELFDYDIICDHWGEFRADRVCRSHIRNNHRDAHCVLGDLHCLHWLVTRFIGEKKMEVSKELQQKIDTAYERFRWAAKEAERLFDMPLVVQYCGGKESGVQFRVTHNWLSERRPEYKVVCKWMYEREEERKTDDSLDAKETRDAVMIAGGMGGGGWRRRREWQTRVRNEIETHRIAI